VWHEDPLAARERLGRGRPLDPAVRGEMEHAFGRGFAGVRVHTDQRGGRLAGSLAARAVTVGDDIAFAPGQYRPGTLEGNAVIAHELAHVSQQGAPRAEAQPGVEPEGSEAERDAESSTMRALAGAGGPGGARARARTRGLALQRCPVSSSLKSGSGEFTVSPYRAYDSASGDVAKQVGADIGITFIPADTVRSDEIAFVQVARTTKGGTPYYIEKQAGRATTAAQGEEGWFLDRVADRKYPHYGRDDTGAASATTRFGYRKSATDFQSAWMSDEPRYNRAVGQTVTFTAIAYALDTKGSAYLGGLRWGFEANAAGDVTKLPLSVFAMGAPAGVQKAALEKWNEQAKSADVTKRNAPGQLEVPVP
jgi:hypothetical protein